MDFHLLRIQTTNSGLWELFHWGLSLPINVLPRFLAHLGTQSQFSRVSSEAKEYVKHPNKNIVRAQVGGILITLIHWAPISKGKFAYVKSVPLTFQSLLTGLRE